ncbi:MAG TPA: efflux RND transporter periplasmic adaptor subunit [Terriglobales bacterium]|nr:efflux RND transporter periplasmic adaptor subunit [Terriglobales bacterium]
MKLLQRRWLLLLIVALVVVLTAAFFLKPKNEVQYFTTKVDRGDIHQVVQATGTINAVITVQVGSQVSGTIAKLYADFNSKVKQGQVIAEIDPRLFEGAVLQARADYQNAVANAAAAKANLEKAQATAVQTKADYDRTVVLAQKGVMSQQQLDLAKANADTAEAAVSATQAQLVQANAQTAQKKAAVTVAETNLNYCTIRAPIDGVVVARNVDVGQTVASSLQAPTLFTIAQDLTKMQVYAQTDESDVGQIQMGQPATFTVDAFPGQMFKGKVSQIRLNATVVQNVVTYNTIVDFDNPDMKLLPGMTAYVNIPVANAGGVLKIPNGALRYKPDLPAQAIRNLYAKYGIDVGGARKTATGQGSGKGQGGGAGQAGTQGGRGQGGGQGSGRGAGATPSEMEGLQASDTVVVWKLLPDKTLQPVKIRTGITDHTFTALAQVLQGDLKEGDLLVTGSATTGGPPSLGPGGPRR